jgi:CRISPR/Cas system-associated exonuclease Cas4 (RecB family)
MRPVVIDAGLIEEMIEAAEKLRDLKRESVAPLVGRKPICPACSYRFLCGHA